MATSHNTDPLSKQIDAIDEFANNQTASEQLHVMTQPNRLNIARIIIAHPSEMPSAAELDYHLHSIGRSTIDQHLATMIEHNVIARGEIPGEAAGRDRPKYFYTLTTNARYLYDKTKILPERQYDTLAEMYENLELPEGIQKLAELPRPEPLEVL